MQRKRMLLAFVVIFMMFGIIAAYTYVSYASLRPKDGTICEGVTVEHVAVGGMTKDQAREAVSEETAKRGRQVLEVEVSGSVVTTTLAEVGYTFSAEEFLDEAMKVGRKGNLIENYKEIKQARKTGVSFGINRQMDEKVLKKFVKKKCKKLCTSAQNAQVSMENGEFVYSESKEGITLDVAATVENIQKAVSEAKDDTSAIRVAATVEVEKPAISKETAERCKDKIGSFSTTFNAGNVNRSKNVANAARLISGSVLYPGETFSVHDAISPLTEENGYYAAASYNQGKVEDTLGGGVCQVSTTLYNAVLRAELEVVERSPHSMVVSYVEPSMDAAIAGDYKDFKFKNNTEVPIYIQGGTYNGTLYFNIYGEETRSEDRSVTFKSEVTDTIEPGADKITYDKTKPESYESVTQEAHTGYKAILWKIVDENGKETKTQVNSSTYAASPRYVTKGAKKEEAKPEETKAPKTKAKPEKDTTSQKRKAAQTERTQQKAQATTQPAATQAPVVVPQDGENGGGQ